jgi:hypothetical protein
VTHNVRHSASAACLPRAFSFNGLGRGHEAGSDSSHLLFFLDREGL